MEINQILEATALANFKARTVIDDQDVGILVKYIGAQPSGTVEVTVTTGDITFKHGVLASEVVDTTIDSGGDDPGVIDVSDANANTFGEVVDLINASPNWEAKLVDVLRADASTAGMLLTMAETQAKVTKGIKLLKDTSACLNLSLAIDRSIFKGIEVDNDKWINSILKIISTNTFGSGTSLIQIYDINREDKTEEKIFERAGGATTVEQDLPAAGSFFQIDSTRDGLLLVRMIGSVACTGRLTVIGKQVNFISPDY